MRWLVTVMLVSLYAPPSVFAQSQDWLVLPTTSGAERADDAWMVPTVDSLSRELRTRGVGVWSRNAAVDAFENRGSTSPTPVSDADIEAWSEGSEQALRKLAMLQREEALAELEAAQAFSETSLETLNREPDTAQDVLDTCLYLVRARSATGDTRGAAQQAEECVRMVPNGEPSPKMHPPDVVDLFARANDSPDRTGTLRVESDPTKCNVRLNGVLVGDTPVDVRDLYPGTYRVQLECTPGVGSRVHQVDVSPRGRSMFILDRFDEAVRTDPVLHLAYDEPTNATQRAADARLFGRTLPAPVVVMATPIDDELLELRVVSTSQMETTLAQVPMTSEGPPTNALPSAVSALLSGQCLNFASDDPVRIDCTTGAPRGVVDEKPATATRSRAPVRPPRGQYIAGVTLASTGTLSILTSYALLIARRSAGENWLDSPNSVDAQSTWLNLGTGLLVTGSAGAGLLVAGMPLALPYRAKTPWWAWLSGGLGLAATAGAIASIATASSKPTQSCSVSGPDPTPCVDRERDTDRAFILGMTAAPLLTMPLVYLLRSDEKKLRTELSPMLVTGRNGGMVGIGGTF